MSVTASPESRRSGGSDRGPARARRTLRGRVSLLGLVVITAWVLVLTAGFNLLLSSRRDAEIDSALRTRAMTASATVNVSPAGQVTVVETNGDEALDSTIWVFAGTEVVVKPPADPRVQAAAGSLAGAAPAYREVDDFRLYALPVSRRHRRVATVVALVSTQPYERAGTEALVGSGIVAVLVLLGAYPVLRFAAARALRPVDSMTRQAGDWSAHAVTERFGGGQRYREVETLAGTLDGVLDRLSAVIRHERRLSAELSHELRTPLSRIVAETDLLVGRDRSLAEQNAAHQAIHDSAMAMERILETLLSAARMDVRNVPGRCELAPAMADVIRSHERDRPGDRTLDVRCDIPADLAVGVDAAVVERILAPLLDNARRYAGHEIVISARRSGEAVFVEISDDGPGVPPELAEFIFEPGRRGSVEDDHDGAGLGLALARRLARAATGDVTLIGPDARFRVRLPPA